MNPKSIKELTDVEAIREDLITKGRERLVYLENVRKVQDVQYQPWNLCSSCLPLKRVFIATRISCYLGVSVMVILFLTSLFVIGKETWFSSTNMTASILLTVFLSLTSIYTLFCIILWIKRPRKVIITKKTYYVRNDVQLDNVVPDIHQINEGLRSYIEKAVNKYYSDVLPQIVESCIQMDLQKIEYSTDTYMTDDKSVIISSIGEEQYNTIFIDGSTVERYDSV